MAVFVLDKRKKPLMPCSEKRARLMLQRGRARVHRMMPFTIRLVDRLQADSALQPLRLKLDPGSKTTGLALVREQETVDSTTGEIIRTLNILMLLELKHRGHTIRDSMTQRGAFRRRRRGKLRHRPARFNNRTKPEGWLAPSLQHRVDTVLAWVNKLIRLAPITALSQELVRFDMQAMQNPEIVGTEYQQGTLQGYEVREYLLEKWGRECAYCGAEQSPLEIDHIHPRSKGGSDRVSNLAIACHDCNQAKGNMPLTEFLAKHPEWVRKILAQAKAPLRDAAAVNSTRRALLTKHGFPRGYLTRSKSVFGFQTGDMVKAIVTTGRKAGTYLGRVAIRASGSFNIQTGNGLVQHIHHRFCKLVQRGDGYGYHWSFLHPALNHGVAEAGRN